MVVQDHSSAAEFDEFAALSGCATFCQHDNDNDHDIRAIETLYTNVGIALSQERFLLTRADFAR